MRVLHLCASDGVGGAAKGAYRLHQAFHDDGIDSTMAVWRKETLDPTVEMMPRVWWKQKRDFWLRWRRPKIAFSSHAFNFDFPSQYDFSSLIRNQKTDAMIVHWINGFLSVRDAIQLRASLGCPLIWVLLDAEPMTGGCHYPLGCQGFEKECGNCPQICPSGTSDRSWHNWREKRKLLEPSFLTLVTPTRWLEEMTRKSSLFAGFQTVKIPLALDAKTFHPMDRREARERLRLPQDQKIIFFGSHNLEEPRKGMELLFEALRKLKRHQGLGKLFLAVAGPNTEKIREMCLLPSKALGLIRDDWALALAYQAADLFVCPSIEDAGPMMISESLLCGTPVAAFDTGIARDVITDDLCGKIAPVGSVEGLADAMMELLSREEQAGDRFERHRRVSAWHSPSIVVGQYRRLIEQLIEKKR